MKKPFIDDDFLLETDYAAELYHQFAKEMPIIDYHCHIDPKEIAENKSFDNLSQIWLRGDHYKWRAMRANGISEDYITGNKSDFEKFNKWAETVPYTLRNPLYHWTHLELKKPFGVSELLNPKTADSIYQRCSEMLQTDDYSVQNIIKKSNVEIICTTDDPVDNLEHHQLLRKSDFDVRVLPTWRPDKAMAVEDAKSYNAYLDVLGQVADIEIDSYNSLIDALKNSHDYFAENGCKLSDHGIEEFYSDEFSDKEIKQVFNKVRKGNNLSIEEIRKFKSAMLFELARLDYDKNWVQQFHYGPIRNNNSLMFEKLGPDTGFDSMGDFNGAISLSRFLNRLARENKLAKTIIYNINPKDNDMIATMIANFQDGSVPGKIQFGSGWWFLDQKEGMEAQLNSLSNHGLLSRFIGMLTDSRSFLSYSRHEYFRRILCNILGNDMEKGLIPDDMELLRNMVKDISYRNAKQYFNF